MKNKHFSFKSTVVFLVALLLITSCASTTLIETIPSGADVYLNNMRVGTTPYAMTDSKITGTCTYVRLEMEGYESLQTDICRLEDIDVGAVVGGFFFFPAFLWTMKYYPNHTYELYPLAVEENSVPLIDEPSSKAKELRELKQLLDDGIITQDEFDAQKKKILEAE
jgi:hypothetical protein